MLIRRPSDLRSADITPEAAYLNRREFVSTMAGVGAAVAMNGRGKRMGAFFLGPDDDKPTSYESITHFNNYYEFGTDKADPAEQSGGFHPRPWKLEIAGEVKKPAVYDLDDLLKPFKPEERVYRHRCVEAWSMVIPWLGFPLADLIRRLEPTSRAKFVEFTTVLRPSEMPGQRGEILPWPYVEALRMDEALNPLTLMVTGIYGKSLLNQNGAPLRTVIPWKYGFKGCKSIVKIRFAESQPATTWNMANGHEYGFYANVNPEVDHPRWSQARERRIGELFKRPTLMFNGYADQVAGMYAGMDLVKNY